MSSATPVLSLDKVSKVYPGSKALSGVSLDIHAGEVLGLIGQNGAGKSTIVKILSGAIQPTEGRILIEGRPVSFAGSASAQRASGHARSLSSRTRSSQIQTTLSIGSSHP